jgi:predicted transcriptional regulator of viral defense system
VIYKKSFFKTKPDVGENQRALIKGRILEYLRKTDKLKEVIFEFPSRKETRYLFGGITNFELAQSLKPNAYLAHRAAMFLNGLSGNYPRTIHINVEQSQHHKRNTNSLTQAAIDRAFENKTRVSNEIAEANGIQVCITHGQKTDQLGVGTKKGPDGEILRVTNIERTLIDITVRPKYAGGPKEVVKAYRNAADVVSIDQLLKMLKKMNFVYPFHQSVGF